MMLVLAIANDGTLKRKETRSRKRKHPVVEPVPSPPNLNQIRFDELFSYVKGGVQLYTKEYLTPVI